MEALAGGKPLSARARQISRSREELLGLLADLPGGDSDRELSFSDLVVVKESTDHAATPQPPAQKDHGSSLSSERQEAASKQQQAARERRLRRRRSDSRGSCGGSGDGVLLNFYVPGLLTRSMTAPRPGRGTLPAGAGRGSPATVAAGKSRIEAPLAVGCWPALWGRGRDRRNKPAKPAAERRDTRVSV